MGNYNYIYSISINYCNYRIGSKGEGYGDQTAGVFS
mgnify:CR=1 FL=1